MGLACSVQIVQIPGTADLHMWGPGLHAVAIISGNVSHPAGDSCSQIEHLCNNCCQLCKYLETCVRSDYAGPAGQLMVGVEVIQHTLQRLSGSYDNTPGAKWQRTARKDLVREGMSLQGGCCPRMVKFLASYLFESLQILIITFILLGWSFISGHKK